MDGMPKEWETAVGRMHRVVEDRWTLPWEFRRVLGGRVVCLGPNEMLCPLETTGEMVALLAKAPLLASLVDAALSRASDGACDVPLLQTECRKAVGGASTTLVGPWRLESARRCGVKSVVLTTADMEIGLFPVERKYLHGEVDEAVADLAVAASMPELMAACLCLADDPADIAPCRFAMDSVVANVRKGRLLMPSRGRKKSHPSN